MSRRACRLDLFLLSLALLLLAACTGQRPPFAGKSSHQVTFIADGRSRTLSTEAANVRELLAEANVVLGGSDEVSPPLFTPLSDGLTVTVTRVTESIVLIERSVPFGRKIVRSESMNAGDPPRLIQAGKSGLEELTVRIVSRDGIESERLTTQVQQIEPAQDEIVMIGIGAAPGNVTFSGLIATISGGQGLLLRGNTSFPEQLDTGADLDGRVFALSPTGGSLLYTQKSSARGSFNSLWVIATAPGARPRPLGVENVLWAAWNPARTELQQIAYTTGKATDLPPGWEANNDLWLGDVLQSESAPFAPERLIEAYPATFGWWGGNYAWSPSGRYLAFSYADEVGLIDLEARSSAGQRLRLQKFVEFNTGGDWVWVPSLSWSPDGRYLTFTNHAGSEPGGDGFDVWVVDVASRVAAPFVSQAGMWANPHWAPVPADAGKNAAIAYLQATDPLESERSSYTLWFMDQDGSNRRQGYPPPGEVSRFPREEQFMAWGAAGHDLAFIFNNALYLLSLDTGQARRITQDDSVNSNPTWAPYGPEAASGGERPTTVEPLPTPERRDSFLPDG